MRHTPGLALLTLLAACSPAPVAPPKTATDAQTDAHDAAIQPADAEDAADVVANDAQTDAKDAAADLTDGPDAAEDADTHESVDVPELLDVTDDADTEPDFWDEPTDYDVDVEYDSGWVADIPECLSEFSAAPGPGEPGFPCTTKDDCDFGFCIETPNGNVCTHGCDNTLCACPTNWFCELLDKFTPIYGCAPGTLHLCDPCDADSDCTNPYGGPPTACIPSGGSAFCAEACDSKNKCPSGYTCTPWLGTSGKDSYCLPTSGTCTCSPLAIKNGVSASCKVTNSAGTCLGNRTCSATGLTACSAAIPAMEACNGIDDDCDGLTDVVQCEIDKKMNDPVGCTVWYADKDGDGFGSAGSSACLCAALPDFPTQTSGDCDDDEASAFPGGKEACDSVDNNCNGTTDENCEFIPGTCTPTEEICDSYDNDCDGIADNIGAIGCVNAYIDTDGDGFGDPKTKACVCGLLPPYNTFQGADCAPGDIKIHPFAKEVCNGVNDNCDSQTDEANAVGCSLFYADADGDGFGNPMKSECLCAATPAFSVPVADDCADNAADVAPNVTETCNGKDDNCSGSTDEEGASGCVVFYVDSDSDGFGDSGTPGKCLCSAGGKWTVITGGDCNDGGTGIHPGSTETCDGKDENCDNVIDNAGASGCTTWWQDSDGDGWGDSAKSQCLCGGSGKFTSQVSGDCNDGDAGISPGIADVCADGIDNNCNGVTDSDASASTIFYVDSDGDGWGAGTGKSGCGPSGGFTSQRSGDCNDGNGKIHPKGSEICNGIDDNCDGITDDGSSGSLCGAASNGSFTCAGAGGCVLGCSGAWSNLDGDNGNGCECFSSVGSQSCTDAVDLGWSWDNGVGELSASGNILPGEGGDWYAFKAVDIGEPSGTCDAFNVRIWLDGNPDGQFAIDVRRNGCGAPQELCADVTESTWSVNFHALPFGPGKQTGGQWGDSEPSPFPEIGGECPCFNGTGIAGMNLCVDDSAMFFVRVHRLSGAAASCGNYVLKVTNGKTAP